MSNLYGVIPLIGFSIVKEPFQLLYLSEEKHHIFIGLSYLSTLPPFENTNLASLLLSPTLMQTIGYSDIEVIRNCPLLVFRFSENAFGDLENTENLLKAETFICSVSVAFSMACWLLKPSSVYFERMILKFNQAFISNKIDFRNYDFRCCSSQADFYEGDLKQLMEYSCILRSYTIFDQFQHTQQGIVLFGRLREFMGDSYKYYEQTIPFRTLIPGKGPSFYTALKNLQKYLESTQIPDRFQNGCTALEALFATDDKGIKEKLAKRVAAIIASDENEAREVYLNMKNIYHLRSEESHGEGVFIDSSCIELSKHFDDYLRKTFVYFLFKPDLNYGSFEGKEVTVSKKHVDQYFQTIVKNCGWFE